MFRHVLRTYQLLSRWASRPTRHRSYASLDITRLEERANPDATSVMTLPLAPQSFVAAPAIPVPTDTGLTIPMAGQSIVRLDLIAPGEGPQSEYADDVDTDAQDNTAAKTLPEDADAQPVKPATVTDEELAEMIEQAAVQEAG
jgi:hypothetical protein